MCNSMSKRERKLWKNAHDFVLLILLALAVGVSNVSAVLPAGTRLTEACEYRVESVLIQTCNVG